MSDNFLLMHLKLFTCGNCNNPNLKLEKPHFLDSYMVICMSCGKHTATFDNPTDAYFEWRDNFQTSIEQSLKDVIDEFDT